MASYVENKIPFPIDHHEDASEDTNGDNISVEHRNFLLKHHGTADLDPLPSMDLVDPLNWPSWKKNLNLIVIGSMSLITFLMTTGISPAFVLLAKDLHVTVYTATYLTSSTTLAHGVGPVLWRPISDHYGRRPVWIVSTLGSCLFNIGCAYSYTYAAQQVCRILAMLFMSASVGIGTVVVTETFFAKERATKMGLWTLATNSGIYAGPFLMGFVVTRTGTWQWVYWIFAITNATQFVLALVLCPETRFLGPDTLGEKRSTFKRQYMSLRCLTSERMSLQDFYRPFKMAAVIDFLVPTVAYSIVFAFATVFFTVELPPLFNARFNFNPEQNGLQYISPIIGSIIGELVGGRLSDFWMTRGARRLGHRAPPEYRLWLSYIGFAVAIAGFLTFGLEMQKIGHHYRVTPIVGAGMAGFGNQLLTTVLTTYAVDANPQHSTSVGVCFNVFRSTWGWIGPFWFPKMISSIGLAGSGGLMGGIILGASALPVMLLHWRRSRKTMTDSDNSST